MMGMMHTESPTALLEFARTLARQAVELARKWSGEIDPSFKRDGSVVTAVDRALQDHIVGEIARRFPGHAICAEEKMQHPERHASAREAKYCWVIDPLDGTRNFALGFPCFATAIGVVAGGVPVAVVVREHNLDTECFAARGEGAYRDGVKVAVSDPPEGTDTLLGVPSTKDELTVTLLRHWAAVPHIVTRNVGVSNVHLALVASGGLSAAYNRRAKIWDVAPGALLVTEGGGRMTDPFGDELIFDVAADPDLDVPFLAGAPRIHARLLDSIREATAIETGRLHTR